MSHFKPLLKRRFIIMQHRFPKKIAIVVSSPMTVSVFLRHQISVLADLYEVTVVVNLTGVEEQSLRLPNNVVVHHLPIQRQIGIRGDLKALLMLRRLYVSSQFDIIHSVTPKAGLLSMMAGWMAHVPIRIHTFTGQVWAVRAGIVRRILRFMDKIIVGLSTNILVDSFSQRDFLIGEGVLSIDEGGVLGEGSISGVDIQRFVPSARLRSALRQKLCLDENTFMMLFVGRLKVDKGVMELADAFSRLWNQYKEVSLVVVGSDEDDAHAEMTKRLGSAEEAVRFVSFTEKPETFMAAADLFVLPSYREGFGTVIIEAAACGVPAVASRIYGLTDAVLDGESGMLFDVRDVDEMTESIEKLFLDRELCRDLGEKARSRAVTHFSQDNLTNELVSFYKRLS